MLLSTSYDKSHSVNEQRHNTSLPGCLPRKRTISSPQPANKEIIETAENKLLGLLERKIMPLQINTKSLWKVVFMERKHIEDGKWAYEGIEPGYLQGIYKGYALMLETLTTPLTSSLYKDLHDACAKDVKSEEAPEGIPLGFRTWQDGAEGFPLIMGETCSQVGISELFDRYRTYKYIDPETQDEYYPLKDAMVSPLKTTTDPIPTLRLKPTTEKTCSVNVDFCISLYEKAPKRTEEEKLHAIARLCQDLDQFHVFVDGNIRTTGILVLNKLLLENKLAPAAMKDVNQLDCLSEQEIVDLIKEGQEYFRKAIGDL